MPNLEHGEAVFGVPPFGAGVQDGVLDRQRGGGFDEGVDAGGVRFEHGAGFGGERFPVALDRIGNLKAAHGGVMLDARRARQLRPSSIGASAVGVHVPQPVLGGGEPLPEKGVLNGLGADVRDAARVSDYGNAVVRSVQRQRGFGVGNRGREVFGG